MLQRHRPLIVLTLLVASCQSSAENASAPPAEPIGTPVALASPPALAAAASTGAPSGLPECSAGEVACAQTYDPVVCSAGLYADRPVPLDDRVMAWGVNPCVGRQMLAKEACHLHLAPSKLGQIQCVPDSSEGNCPAPAAKCPGSGSPVVCTAARYGDQKLAIEQELQGSGPGDCAATQRLLALACRQNLNPKLVKEITCHPDQTGGECPPKLAACRDMAPAATCAARKLDGRELDKPLEARGETACVARQELAKLACRQGVKPSTLDEIVCVFGR